MTHGPAALRSALVLVLVLSASMAQAQPNRQILFKQAAIFGSVLTWVYATVIGAPLTDCARVGNNLRLEYGEDKELTLKTVGFFQHECTLQQLEAWRLTYPIFVTFQAISNPTPLGTRMDTGVCLKSDLLCHKISAIFVLH